MYIIRCPWLTGPDGVGWGQDGCFIYCGMEAQKDFHLSGRGGAGGGAMFPLTSDDGPKYL